MAANDVALIDAYIRAKERADAAQMVVADMLKVERMLAAKLTMISDCLDRIEANPDVPPLLSAKSVRMWLRWLSYDSFPPRHEAQMEETKA
jgi:hypothetical protein